MNKTVRNLIAVVLAIVVGGLVNMGIIMLTSPANNSPEEFDIANLETRHFIFIFFAHALGTLIGSIIAAFIATEKKLVFSLAIGFFFLMGGIIMAFSLPAPQWFEIMDLSLAYIPMAIFGWVIVTRRKRNSA